MTVVGTQVLCERCTMIRFTMEACVRAVNPIRSLLLPAVLSPCWIACGPARCPLADLSLAPSLPPHVFWPSADSCTGSFHSSRAFPVIGKSVGFKMAPSTLSAFLKGLCALPVLSTGVTMVTETTVGIRKLTCRLDLWWNPLELPAHPAWCPQLFFKQF